MAAVVTIYIVLGILYESYIHPFTILTGLAVCRRRRAAGAAPVRHGPEPDRGDRAAHADRHRQEERDHDDRRRADHPARGQGAATAIYDAALLRFRPIMMTILNIPALQPKKGLRHSPISAVLLTGAEIDQAAGLLTLRERQDVALHATPATLAAIADNPMFGALHPDHVKRYALSPGETVSPLAGLSVEIFTDPGKMPLHLEGENPEIGESAVNVGVELISGERGLLYIPGAAGVTPAMRERMRRAEAILFDGTLFDHDEMIGLRAEKTAWRMGHVAMRRRRLGRGAEGM